MRSPSIVICESVMQGNPLFTRIMDPVYEMIPHFTEAVVWMTQIIWSKLNVELESVHSHSADRHRASRVHLFCGEALSAHVAMLLQFRHLLNRCIGSISMSLLDYTRKEHKLD